jgi:DNA-binding transcriptional regulator YiaG
LRGATAKLRKASTQHRLDIAALKRRIASLEKQVPDKSGKTSAALVRGGAGARIRYSAKGLSTQRQRLGLSAAHMGMLLGVSAQTIYHWESGKSRPRPQQLTAIGAVRGLGKRAAADMLKRQLK